MRQIKHKINFKDGLEHGLSESDYENGQLSTKINHKDGRFHGLWEQFNEDGSLKITETFQNGIEQNGTD